MAVIKDCGEEWIFSQNERLEENSGSDSEKPFGLNQVSIHKEISSRPAAMGLGSIYAGPGPIFLLPQSRLASLLAPRPFVPAEHTLALISRASSLWENSHFMTR